MIKLPNAPTIGAANQLSFPALFAGRLRDTTACA